MELPVLIAELGEDEAMALHPELRRVFPLIIHDFTVESGLRAVLSSAFRGIPQQRTLYLAYKRGGPRAAPPGDSAHNYGLAGDVLIIPPDGEKMDKWEWATATFRGRRAYRALHRVAKRYGLVSIIDRAPDDPFHLQVPNWRNYIGKVRQRA